MIAFTFGSARGIGSRAADWLAAKSLLRSNMESRVVIFVVLYPKWILGRDSRTHDFWSRTDGDRRDVFSIFRQWNLANVPSVPGFSPMTSLGVLAERSEVAVFVLRHQTHMI